MLQVHVNGPLSNLFKKLYISFSNIAFFLAPVSSNHRRLVLKRIIALVPKEEFEWIEEWHANEDRKYLVGVIAFARLKNSNWWKENNNSLILTPDPVIEETETRKLKKGSLELAGIG